MTGVPAKPSRWRRWRAGAVALSLALGLPGVSAEARSREWHVSLGVSGGGRFSRDAPFEFAGMEFGGPYNLCKQPTPLCFRDDAGDVAYSIQDRNPLAVLGGLDLRIELARSFWVCGGVLGGAAKRQQRLFRNQLNEVVYSRPSELAELREAALEPENEQGRAAGTGAFLYLHGGIERELGLDWLREEGQRPFPLSVLMGGGLGVLAALPDGGDAGVGTPPAFHLLLGVRLRRNPGHDLTLALYHVRAIANTDHLTDASLAWTGVQAGIVIGR